MATIKDVSKEAGVSIGTVSRYLNGYQIKKANQEKVDAAIKKLDYKINNIARGLKTNRTYTIGVLIPDLADIYSTTIVKNIEKKLYQYGYSIIVCDSNGNSKLEKEKSRLLINKQIDGLIIYSCLGNISYLNSITNNKIPVVAIDNLTHHYQCDQVLTDNIAATYNAVKYLINNNHRRIGIICGKPNNFTAKERVEGYKRALTDYGLEIDTQLVYDLGYAKENGYNGLNHLMSLSVSPTAIITCNYYTTIGAYKAICHNNINIPFDLSFIGWDDIGLSEITSPPLTIIQQPMNRVGDKAAELILERIKGGQNTPPSIARFETTLVIRKSTSPL